jgi:hypothetical protein
MTLVLRPMGRGGWTPLRLEIPPRRKELPLLPITVKVGERIEIAGRTFRIAEILA